MKFKIQFETFIVMFIFALLRKLDIYLIFIIFISFHEISHLLYGFLLGGKIKEIKLAVVGLSLEIEFFDKISKLNKILFFFSGPFINFLIYFILRNNIHESNLYTIIVITNIMIFLINILPILPLDGGNILKELLNIYFDYDISYRITLIISKIFLSYISFISAIYILKVHNIYILFLIGYLWKLYFIEDYKYINYLKTKDIVENNLKNY